MLFLAVVLSFRSYKLLYSNLFLDRSIQGIQGKSLIYPNEQACNPMSKISGLGDTLPMNSVMVSQGGRQKQHSMGTQNKENKENTKDGNFLPLSMVSKKPISFNSGPDSINDPAVIKVNPVQIQGADEQGGTRPVPASGIVAVGRETASHRRFNHPFLTYLTVINLLTATLLILIGSSIQIYKATFSNMLFWGVDALIVVILSLFLTAWDLWTFTNLRREEQNSEMSSQVADVNHTHENLRQEAEIEVHA